MLSRPSALGLLYLSSCVSADPDAVGGPFTTTVRVYDLNEDGLVDEQDKVSVWYPTGVKEGSNATLDNTMKFISYAHGMFGGGVVEVPGYNDLLHAMASFGYVIGATHQCTVGCFDDCQSLRHDPPCYGNYYKKQLGIIDWAKECAASSGDCSVPFEHITWSSGVGIAGHSMGGQATLFSSTEGNATAYDIRAAVMHHAYTHTFPVPSIPFLDMTGDLDTTAPVDSMAVPIYEAADGSGVPRGFVDKTTADHHEPDITSLNRNGIELVSQFSAAWFKLYLDKTPVDYGIDFQNMIYGSDDSSICNGGDGQMTSCKFDM